MYDRRTLKGKFFVNGKLSSPVRGDYSNTGIAADGRKVLLISIGDIYRESDSRQFWKKISCILNAISYSSTSALAGLVLLAVENRTSDGIWNLGWRDVPAAYTWRLSMTT